MKKWAALLLVLVLTLPLLAGCGETDPEKIAATVVAEVNGESITKGEAEKMYAWLLNQVVAMNAQYGYTVDPAAADTISYVKENTLNVLVEGVALRQKLAELGNGLTDADMEDIKTRAQEEYDATVASLLSSGQSADEAEAVALMDSQGYTLDAIEYAVFREELENRLSEFVKQDVTVSEEDLQADYTTHVEEAQTTYAETPNQYINDVMNGAAIYYTPEGVRFIKNIVIGFTEETNALITEKNSERYSKQLEQYMLQSERDGKTDLTDAEALDYQTRLDTLAADIERMTTELEALQAQGREEVRPQAEEVLEKAKAEGADFDALMAEYSSDTATGDLLDRGYPVIAETTLYVQSFTDGSMALENIGDVSDLVESSYGFHILQYASDGQAGATPFESLKSDIEAHVLEEAQSEAINAKFTEWIEAANIKTYINKF